MIKTGLEKVLLVASSAGALLASAGASAGITAAPVPEPDMFALLAVGAVGGAIALKLRRRK